MHPAPAKRPVLVLGIGNILMSDDGVGPRVVEALASCDLPPYIELMDGGTGGPSLLDAVADRTKVVAVDALDAGLTPGTIVRMSLDDLARPEKLVSLHDCGLPDAIHMAGQLGCAPRHVIIVGVQKDRVEPGLELSPTIRSAVPDAAAATLAAARI